MVLTHMTDSPCHLPPAPHPTPTTQEAAIEAYETVNLNHTSVQQKTDLEMAKAMVALQAGHATAMKKYLDAAEAYVIHPTAGLLICSLH